MINFFRKIRKELANENQFVKYAMYAVGEILLVVIGILIALQINNWNENRKAGNAEQRLYNRTLSDINHEQISLKEALNDFNIILESLNHIYNETKGRASQDTVNHFYNNIRWTYIVDLVVSDKLKTEFKITNNIISELINQKSKIEDRIKYIIISYNKYKTDVVNPYLTKNGVFDIDEAYRDKQIGFYELSKLDLVKYDSLKTLYNEDYFNQILFELKSKSLYIIVQLERLIEKNHELKTALEKKINKKFPKLNFESKKRSNMVKSI